jgi:tRNA (uracil-5-)-methyltransferase
MAQDTAQQDQDVARLRCVFCSDPAFHPAPPLPPSSHSLTAATHSPPSPIPHKTHHSAQLDQARKMLAGFEQMNPPSVAAAVACASAAAKVARAAGALAKARLAPPPPPPATARPPTAAAAPPAPGAVVPPTPPKPQQQKQDPPPPPSQQQQQKPTQQPAPAAAAAAPPPSPSPDHARALELLPASDDGTCAAVAGVPAGWGPARLSAFLERTGVKPLAVEKAPGEARALARFAGPGERAKARQALADMGPSAAAGLALLLPGRSLGGSKRPAPEAAAAAGGQAEQEKGAGAAATATAPPAHKKAARAAAASSGEPNDDVRAAVCPWHDVAYGEQLRRKASTVLDALRRAADGVQGIYDSRAAAAGGEAPTPPPAWLAAAAQRPGGAAAPLPAIVRAPQLEAYRSKSEFSVGRDLQGRPAVGFLHGSFRDGVTAVGDASRCRHTGHAARAYAALLQRFLRGGGGGGGDGGAGAGGEGAAAIAAAAAQPATGDRPSALDAWDKASNSGFWRLLLVREGRAATFLPLPGGGQAAAAASLAEVPLERWLVRLPDAQFGGLEEPNKMEEDQQQQQQHPAVDAFRRMLLAPPSSSPAAAPPPALADVPPLLEPQNAAAEPRAPPPDELMLALQINPLYVKNRADASERARLAAAAACELRALAAFFFRAAATSSSPSSGAAIVLPAPTSLLVQYHFGVSNAAPADAPLVPLEQAALDFDAMAAAAAAAAGGAGGGRVAPPINALDGAPPLATGAGSVSGDPQCLHETLCGLRFRVSPAAFFQVNAPATCLLYRLVGDWAAAAAAEDATADAPAASAAAAAAAAAAAPSSAGAAQLLLDVCCGTGTIGVSLADRAASVVGVDSSVPAVEDARRNAEANTASSGGKCTFVAGTAEKELPAILAEAGVASLPAGAVVAVADPPRAGLHKNVLRALLAAKPLRRLVLVSCNPASLADNLVDLCRPAWSRKKAGGGGGGSGGGKGKRGGAAQQEVEVPADAAPFRPVLAAAVDLFPHTPHVEAVVLLERD